MFRRILVAADDDGVISGSAEVLAALAIRWRALVHVVHIPTGGEVPASDRGRVLVGRLVEVLREHGVPATGEILGRDHEPVASSIQQAAASCRADLVAMGTRPRSGLLCLVRGSVSHDTAATLDVPVLLLREDATAPQPDQFTIIAAMDWSLSGLAVLDATRDAAGPYGATVHLVHVLERGVTKTGYVRTPSQTLQVIEATASCFSQESGLRSQPAVLSGSGPVALQLARAAERLDADLVVVGSRRPTNLGSMLAGSVAYELTRRSACPILLAGRPLRLGSRISATSDAAPPVLTHEQPSARPPRVVITL